MQDDWCIYLVSVSGKTNNLCDFLCPLLHTKSFWKSVQSNNEECSPKERGKYFPLRVDPFSEGRQKHFDTPESVSVSLNACIWPV